MQRSKKSLRNKKRRRGSIFGYSVKPRSMNLLQRSIRNFDSFEQNRFRSFISGDSNQVALIKLLNLFRHSATSFSEKELEEKIYGESSLEKSRRVSMLRHRLMEKLEDFLISKQFLEKNLHIDNFTATKIRIIKRLGGFFSLHKFNPPTRSPCDGLTMPFHFL